VAAVSGRERKPAPAAARRAAARPRARGRRTPAVPRALARILVASDLSPRARRAIARAALLAAAHGARLTALHVLDEPLHAGLLRLVSPARARARRRVIAAAEAALCREVAASVRGRGDASVRIETGTPFVTIARRARTEGADLVVLGAHGAHGIPGALVGTTAERVVRHGDRPVLVVKRTPRGPYRRVLVPVDFSEPSARALALAARLSPEAALLVLHVYEVWYEPQLRRAGVTAATIAAHRRAEAREAAGRLAALSRSAGLGDRTVTPLLRRGHPTRAIAGAARRLGADLVVVGSHGRRGLGRALLGSVAERVLREVACDVLVARPPAGGTRAGVTRR
jgi:nucleotide-binding universal stress UspA family protein